jgi:hypothetical protein
MEQTVIELNAPAIKPAEPPPHKAPATRLAISNRFLLCLYAIVPICSLAMVCDRLFWHESLFRSLPTSPETFFVVQLLFGTPHIIASSVILFSNRDYVRTYWLRIVLFSLLLLLFFGGGYLFIPDHYTVFLAVVGAATILHVIKQQVGVGKGLCRLSSWIYDAWGWTMIVFGSILYFAIYSDHGFSASTKFWVDGILLALAGLIFVLTVMCHLRIKTALGRYYLWANGLMVLQSGMFYAEGYSFLAILAPRLVHDLTAFTFYVVHDVNRHSEKPQNLLYRLANKLGLGIFWVCPAIAVLLTFLIGRFADPLADFVMKPVLGHSFEYPVSFLIVGYLGLLHYYTEVFTWRQGSPYREHVALRP